MELLTVGMERRTLTKSMKIENQQVCTQMKSPTMLLKINCQSNDEERENLEGDKNNFFEQKIFRITNFEEISYKFMYQVTFRLFFKGCYF